MTVRAHRDGRVTCHAAIPFGVSAGRAWGQLRDFRRYASLDYFHADVRVAGGVPRAGAALRLTHRFGCFRAERTGRILRWREGEGWAFSDLSRRSPRTGFPHVLAARVEPTGDGRSTLHLTVRGRWTAEWVPLWARRLWLRWVFTYVVARARNEVWAYESAYISSSPEGRSGNNSR